MAVDNAAQGNTSDLPDHPATSLDDTGLGKRPRDARILHMVLQAQGVHAYQERVPLQLMDFAYRYTSGVLSDAVALSAEGYGPKSVGGGRGRGGAASAADEGEISQKALQVAIASRVNYQFNQTLPKDFMMDLANEKNRVLLPRCEREYGVRLPPERYCLTGVGWGLKEEWDSEDEGEGDEDMMDDAQDMNPTEEMVVEREQEDEEMNDDEFEEVMGVGRGSKTDDA